MILLWVVGDGGKVYYGEYITVGMVGILRLLVEEEINAY